MMKVFSKKIITIVIISLVLVSILAVITYFRTIRNEKQYSILKEILEINLPKITDKYMKFIRVNKTYINKTIESTRREYSLLKKRIGTDTYVADDFAKAHKYLAIATELIDTDPYQSLIYLRKAQYYIAIIEGYYYAKTGRIEIYGLTNMLKEAWKKYNSIKDYLEKRIYIGRNFTNVFVKSYIIERHLSSTKKWLEQADYLLKNIQWLMDKAIIYAYIQVSLNNLIDSELIYKASYMSLNTLSENNYTQHMINAYQLYRSIVINILWKGDYDTKSYAYTIYLEGRGYYDQSVEYFRNKYYAHALFYILYSYVLLEIAKSFREKVNLEHNELETVLEKIYCIKEKITNLLGTFTTKNDPIFSLLIDKLLLDTKYADLILKNMYENKRFDQSEALIAYLFYQKTLEGIIYIIKNKELISSILYNQISVDR